MPTNTTSATLGKPPNTLDDYYTIRALLRDFGSKSDPNNGYTIIGPRPAGLPLESKQAGIIAGMVVMMLVIAVPTGVRLHLRATKQQMVWGWDDWAILVAALVCFLYPIFQIIMVVDGGGGTHIWDVTYTQYRTFVIYGQASRTVYYVVVGLVKLSITFFFRRLADKASVFWRIVCDFFLGTCVVYVLVGLFFTPLLCDPPRAFWDPVYRGMLEQPPQCINKDYVGKILGIIHVVQGALVLMVPMAILWTVRIDRAKKARLFLNWFVGAIAVVGGMVKTLYSVFSPDALWTYPENVLLFTSFDLCLGIVTASIPVLDHLIVSSFGFMASRIISSHGGQSDRRSSTNVPSRRNESRGQATFGSYQRTESSENIVNKVALPPANDNLELKIIRTVDVSVSYERRHEEMGDVDSYDEERSSRLNVQDKPAGGGVV